MPASTGLPVAFTNYRMACYDRFELKGYNLQ